MSLDPGSPSTPVEEWRDRVRRAYSLADMFESVGISDDEEAQARSWLENVDPGAYVGSRHHTVPRFLLERWADKAGQVRTYRRIEGAYRVENIRDLAITDFYTVIDDEGRKNSTLESLMGVVERHSKPYINAILSSFGGAPLDTEARAQLAQFASFQSTRTSRRRREVELQAEWYAKTMASGKVGDDELRELTIVPHQNQTIQVTIEATERLMPYFACRPLAVVRLIGPLLYTCDEPVVLNVPGGAAHTADCFLTDQQIEARIRKWRKIKARRRARTPRPGRVVHFSSTMPTGHGVADEILLAISPRTALLWGPLTDMPQTGPIETVLLDADETMRFGNMANAAMCAQALDWIATRTDDLGFDGREFPHLGPLMKVCDGTNAASAAVNEPLRRFRPHRLWRPAPA
jgi:hypothetical protein